MLTETTPSGFYSVQFTVSLLKPEDRSEFTDMKQNVTSLYEDTESQEDQSESLTETKVTATNI